MSRALYDVAAFYQDAEVLRRTQERVCEEVGDIMQTLNHCRKALLGKWAAIYVGGAFKAFSLVRSLRSIGVKTVVVGSQGRSTYIRRYLIGHFREPMDIACSTFSEQSVVFGGKDSLKIGLQNVARQY